MIKMDDYRDEDDNMNWPAYEKARKDNGEVCYKCGTYILFEKGHLTSCVDCKSFTEDDDEVDHEKFVRCPACDNTWNPYDHEDYKAFEDGEHEMWCDECDHKFEIVTYVSYSFQSPARVSEADRERSEQ